MTKAQALQAAIDAQVRLWDALADLEQAFGYDVMALDDATSDALFQAVKTLAGGQLPRAVTEDELAWFEAQKP